MSAIDEDIVPDLLARGVPGAEGPCTTRDGLIYLVAPAAGEVRLLESAGTRVLASTGGIPAGLQLDRDGSLVVADMKHGILRVTKDGCVSEVVRDFEGHPIRGCNDLSFDSLGNLYFTAPAGSSAYQACGELFCRTTDGAVHRLDAGFAFCNGLAVSADDRLLIVAETHTKTLWAYDLPVPGRVARKRVYAILEGTHRGGPDGIDFDVDGRLIATNYGGSQLEVFGRDGRRERRLRLPFSRPSNVHFLGPGSTILLLTEHDSESLWRFDYGGPGQEQYGWGPRLP